LLFDRRLLALLEPRPLELRLLLPELRLLPLPELRLLLPELRLLLPELPLLLCFRVVPLRSAIG
jgi:hypothetical protein